MAKPKQMLLHHTQHEIELNLSFELEISKLSMIR